MSNGTSNDNTFWNRITSGPAMFLIAACAIIAIVAILVFSGNVALLQEWSSEAFSFLAGGGTGYGVAASRKKNSESNST